MKDTLSTTKPKKKKTEDKKKVVKKKSANSTEPKKKKVSKKKASKVASKAKVKRNALALTKDIASGKLSKLQKDDLHSILGDSAEEIQALFEESDGDNAKNLLFKRLLQTLVDLVPYAEDNIRKSKGQRGVYQFNTLITSIRELLIDIQSSQDRGRMGELIFERIIAPELINLGTAVILRLDILRTGAKNKMSKEAFMLFENELAKCQDSIAEEINGMARTVRQNAIDFLQR